MVFFMCVSIKKDFSKRHWELENCNFESCRISLRIPKLENFLNIIWDLPSVCRDY